MDVVSTLRREGDVPDPWVVLELLKPVTWFPPMWAFACGAIASGARLEVAPLLLGIVVAGPLVCATSQAVNDWYDRDVDALNEPDRPIPSGRLPGRWGLGIAVVWSFLSAAAGTLLGPWGFGATVAALVLAWLYSAPPVRLKRNGWLGNTAVGFSYEGLAWVTGAAVLLGGARPAGETLVLAFLYSVGAHGIMTLNDFKSRRGDLAMGIGSLPARLGSYGAALTASAVMAGAQGVVVLLLIGWGHAGHAGAVGALLAVQVAMMVRFLGDPDGRALWMSAVGVPFYVSGMMVSAFAVRGMVG